LLDQETGVRGYFITGDEGFLEPYHRGSDNFTAAAQKLKDLTSDNPSSRSGCTTTTSSWQRICARPNALCEKQTT